MNDRVRLLFGDTLVPDIFISDHMPELEGLACKVYILALHLGQSESRLGVDTIASRLSEIPSAVQTALVQLETHQLVRLDQDGKGFVLRDIKEVELLKSYRPVTSRQPSEISESSPNFEERQSMVQAIAQTFFHDMMSPGWYSQVDQWFEDYKFAPEVVYSLFQECERRNRLGSRAYAKAVADSWYKNGVRTLGDLDRYWADFERERGIIGLVQKNLQRQQLTLPEEKMVRSWVEDLGYGEEMIQLAFTKATSATKPSLNYFDKILRNWSESEFRTPEDVKQSDSRRARKKEEMKRLESFLKRSNLTEQDIHTVKRWKEELGFTEEVIGHVMKISSVASTHPSISYFDRAMHNYYEKGLLTLDAIEEHEAARRKDREGRRQGRGQGGSRSGSASRKGSANFRERKYDDSYVESMYQNAWDALLDYAEGDGEQAMDPEAPETNVS